MPTDCFLKIGDVKGESLDDKHKEWIEVMSYSHGLSQTLAGERSTSGAATAGRVDHQDFSIVKELDTTSPELNLSCCNGTHFGKVTVELCRATGDKDPYMQYTMEDVLISSVSVGGGGAGLPTESVTFNYGKLTWNYLQTDHKTGKPKGNVEKWWSCVDNKGG